MSATTSDEINEYTMEAKWRSRHKRILDGIANHLEELTDDLQKESFLLSHTNFWVKVFQNDDRWAQHDAMIVSKRLFQRFAENVENFATSVQQYEMIEKLNDKEENYIILNIYNIVSTQKSADKLKRNWKQFGDLLRSARVKSKSLKRTICLLEKMSDQIEIKDIQDIFIAMREIEFKLEPESTCPLGDLKNRPGFFGILNELLWLSDKLFNFTEFQTFVNLCSSLIKHSVSSLHETQSIDSSESDINCGYLFSEQAEEEINVPLFNDIVCVGHVAKFLEDFCLSSYRSWLEDVAKDTTSLDQVIKYASNDISLYEEIKRGAEICGISVSDRLCTALKWLAHLDKHKVHMESIYKTLTVFGFSNAQTTMLKSIDTFFDCLDNKKEVTVFAMATAMDELKGLLNDERDDWFDTLLELSKSTELVKFLKESVDDDFRNLIDAVEEHSEQTIDEATVSDLIHVKRFIHPVLKGKCETPEEIFNCLQNLMHKEPNEGKKIATRISNCSHHVHSLKALYLHVANRGELTKEIISNAMTNGSYKWVLEEDIPLCIITLNYKLNKKNVKGKSDTYTYNSDELNDLRSRALLISNRKENDENKKTNAKETLTHLKQFVEVIDMVSEIGLTLNELHSLGHFCYNKSVKRIPPSKSILTEMSKFLSGLHGDLELWKETLKECRNQFSSLNFLYSDQLLLVGRYLDGVELSTEENNHLQNILKFVHPGATLKDMEIYKSTEKIEQSNVKAKLKQIGVAVNKVTQQFPCERRPFPQNDSAFDKQSHDSSAIVQSGELYIVHLETDSTQTIPVLLSLYSNTVKHFPISSEVLFCHELTSSEEINLLIQRSIKCPNAGLHCICNVEKLPNVLQYQLVEELGSIMIKEKCNNRLAVICRGGQHHPIIDYFTSYVHRVQGFDVPTMESCLREVWSDVVMITSTVPGLGKTEYIRTKAAELQCKVESVHISGPVSRKDLVTKLRTVITGKASALHVDISEVSDANFLDACLFEFIVLGCLCSHTKVICLSMKYIFLEVANSVQDRLKDSLVVLSSFKRVQLKWESYTNLIVSKHISSSIQIVCKYLKHLEDGILDQVDLDLSTASLSKPLSSEICRKLLFSHFSSGTDLSFSVINIFLDVLGEQLRKFSASHYFKVKSLTEMLGNKGTCDVRSKLVSALVEVAKEFACRSVISCRSSQKSTQNTLSSKSTDEFLKCKATMAEIMTNRLADMLHWEDTNHLLLAFNSTDSQTVSVIYKDLTKVPDKVKELFKLQLRMPRLPDFSQYEQKDLQSILNKLVKTTSQKESQLNVVESYALTHDNLLKMILIFLRIQANIPVVIMGETGCGKTSLVRHLALTCDVEFEQFSIHAGTTATDIVQTVSNITKICISKQNRQLWLFLDEINTCEHMGLLTEIICHRTCYGKRLPNNCKMIAACNPYRLRMDYNLNTAGLDGKVRTDEYSKLVYRVHSLPETMIDYVWDFGTLHSKDECSYIMEMVRTTIENEPCLEDLNTKIVRLLIHSQQFTRKIQSNEWCVSLRDVHRCQSLILRFIEILLVKSQYPVLGENVKYPVLKDKNLCILAIVLALAHCYQSRFAKSAEREDFWKQCSVIIYNSPNQYTALVDMVRKEQIDFLNRMEIPPGIAKNTALCENVFVLLVCILNRIPVFLVGKPGCSKSLSMQLIKSNLRGKDSVDKYFQTLPNLYIVSYQGSESSTSDGIIKVFEKAEKYLEANKNDNVLPVVLLDEVGLAEASKFNPLKVLHSLLEPATGKLPNIAVVGISNWSLDPAKMNRAIHLSRPDMDVNELLNTGKFISSSMETPTVSSLYKNQKSNSTGKNETLRALAEAYFEYQTTQRVKNFHGLRDYYSLIKYISRLFQKSEPLDATTVIQKGDATTVIQKGLMRNFGGLSNELKEIIRLFLSHISLPGNSIFSWTPREIIKENIEDQDARHLMLITKGDSALGIMLKNLNELQRKYSVIFGSKFDEDQVEDYSYRIINRIILCMESESVLVLKDLDTIYGSLYDMLNQNYSRVGMKNNCRIALGPYNNPMCQVHEKFRCIVLVDEKKVDYTDPPFLNRFEKQVLRFEDIIDSKLTCNIEKLVQWVNEFCNVSQQNFVQRHFFAGFNEDTIPSLVYQITSKETENLNSNQILQSCKNALLWLVPPDAVLRLSKSTLAQKNSSELNHIHKTYMMRPIHNGLCSTLHSLIENKEEDLPPIFMTTNGSRAVIYTHSSIHIDLKQVLNSLSPLKVEKLNAFKSEKQLTKHLREFFESQATLLVLQCLPSEDGQHIPLAKFQIEELQCEFQNSTLPKHICILLHMERTCETKDTSAWQFTFLSGWQLLMVDDVEPGNYPLPNLLQSTIGELLQSEFRPITQSIRDNLVWAFSCTSSSFGERTFQEFSELLKQISGRKTLVDVLSKKILQIIQTADNDTESVDIWDADRWPVKVASDIRLLHSATSFTEALKLYLTQCVTTPLANIVYKLESLSAWFSYNSCQDVWTDIFLNYNLLDIANLEVPQGPGCFKINHKPLNLKCPFSQKFIVELLKPADICKSDLLQIETATLEINKKDYLTVFDQYKSLFEEQMKVLYQIKVLPKFEAEFISDICNFVTLGPSLSEQDRQVIALWFISFKSYKHKLNDSTTRLIESLLCMWRFEPLLQALMELIAECRFILPSDLETLLLQLHVNQSKKELQNCPVDTGNIDTEVQSNESSSAATNNLESITEEQIIMTEEIRLTEFNEDRRTLSNLNLLENITETENDDNIELEIEANRAIHSANCPPEIKNTILISNACASTDNYLQNMVETDAIDPLIQKEDQTFMETKIQDEDHAEETLVSHLCKLLIPNQQILDDCQGFSKWHFKVSTVLSFGSSVSCYPAELHTLRIFNDLATVLCHSQLKESEIESCLLNLADSLDLNDVENSVDTTAVFTTVIALYDNLTMVGVPRNDFQQFISMYILRCIDINPETAILNEFLHHVAATSLLDKNLSHTEFLVFRIFLEADGDNTLLDNLMEYIKADYDIENLNPFNDSGQLLCLDSALRHVTCDKPEFLVLCINSIQNVLMSSVSNNKIWQRLEYVESGGDPALVIYRAAMDVLQNSNTASLKLASSVAYLRTFFHCLAQIIEYDVNQDKFDTHQFLYQNVNSYLTGSVGVVAFLIKELKFGRTVSNLKRLHTKIDYQLNCLKQISFPDDDLSSSLEFCILGTRNQRDETLENQLRHLTADIKPIEKYFNTSINADGLFCLLQALAHVTYFPCIVRQLTDTEKQIGENILNGLHPASPLFEVIERLTCKKSFGINMLQLTPESTFLQQQQASVLIHLILDLVASEAPLPLFWECFIQPTELPITEMHESLQEAIYTTCDTTVSISTCKCWFRMFSSTVLKNCPICDIDTSNGDAIQCVSESQPADIRNGTGCQLIAQTVIRLLVDATLLGSFALDFISDADLLTKGNISQMSLQSDFQKSWEDLAKLLCLPDQDLAIFLHLIINQIDSCVIKRKIDLQRPEELSLHLRMLQSLILDHIKKPTFLFELKIFKDKILVCSDNPIKLHVLEISNLYAPSTNLNNCFGSTSDLFCLTKVRTVDDMKTKFYLMAKEAEYPLIKIYFDLNRRLQLLNHLMPIMNWACLLQQLVNHCLSRQYCKTTTVNTFINTPSQHSEQLKRNFESFRASWECLREKEQLLILQNIDKSISADLPQIHLQSLIQCMIVENAESVIYKVLNALKSIQNEFIDQLLFIADSGKCPSIGFLRKGSTSVAAVKCVLLQNAKKNQVIICDYRKLIDTLLMFAQNDPRFGFGNIIMYNFVKIEMELANKLVLGKAHLIMNHTFPIVTYANELFVKCATVLEEFRSLVSPQVALGQAMKNGIAERRRTNPTYTDDLMRQIEILLCLVKRTHGHADQTIANYIQQWLVSLPGSFTADLLPSVGEPLRLSHLVALYEFVENLQAELAIDSLLDCYKKVLPTDVKKELQQFVDTNYIELRSIQIAFRRFVMRYLTSFDICQDQVDLNAPLIDWMTDSALWPSGVQRDGSLTVTETKGDNAPNTIFNEFPKMLTLEHTYHALQCLDEMLQERSAVKQPQFDLSQKSAGAFNSTTATKAGTRARSRAKMGDT